ncbi:unnamed protein product [Lactuca saligna]|uniref:Uncharacterized protein n=1 Tax=Lactuca saligna TaxID=75948 RepID=A0AA36E6H5_LACSI|nr:unnamed protein product [Lactuca saligna]
MDFPGTIVFTFGVTPTLEYADALHEKYGFQLDDVVLISLDVASFLEPPHRKVLHNNGVNIYELTLETINKVMDFQMLFRSHSFLPRIWVFKIFFFWFSTIEDKFTFYAR